MSHYTIDRFEDGGWAVLEDEEARPFHVPRQWLPDGVQEGDVLNGVAEREERSTSFLRFTLDAEAREERLAKAKQRRDKLPRGPKGDISL